MVIRNCILFFFIVLAQIIHAQELTPSYIRTSGKLPQLAYSNGEDRLGSAKMGYIDTAVVFDLNDFNL